MDVETRDETLARVEVAVLAAMFFVSFGGNTLALLALTLRRRRQLSRMHYFIMHLCVSDLVVAFFHILTQLLLDATGGFVGGYPGDAVLCKLMMYLQMIGPYSSACILMATAIDRHQVICHPLQANCSWTPQRSRTLVAAAWILAATFALPQVFVFDYVRGEYGRIDCSAQFVWSWGERFYVTYAAVVIVLAPLIVLVYTYSSICMVIVRNQRRRGGGDDKEEEEAATGPLRTHSVTVISTAKMRTIKMTVVVVVCYAVCCMPFYSSMLYVTWSPEERDDAFHGSSVFTILALMASLNSCVNPWLYLAFNENLMATLKDLLCCRLDHRRTVLLSRSSITNHRTITSEDVVSSSRVWKRELEGRRQQTRRSLPTTLPRNETAVLWTKGRVSATFCACSFSGTVVHCQSCGGGQTSADS